jgi:cytochrome P450
VIEADINLAVDPMPGDELHHFFRWAREAGPVIRVPFLDSDGYLVTRWADLRRMFGDEVGFPGELLYQATVKPIVGETFLSMEVPRHDLYRHMATPAFKARAVSHLGGTDLERLANELVDAFYEKGEADLVPVLARPLPSFAICRKLGLPIDDELHMRQLALAIFGQHATSLTPEQAVAEITAIIAPLASSRRKNPGDDVLSQLALAERDGVRLSDVEVANHVKLLFAAGAGNTGDGIALMLQVLLTQRHVLDAAKDPKRRDDIISELFRYEPVLPVLPRIAGPKATIGDFELPAGQYVLAGLAAANRDPRRYDNADRFDPDRRPPEVLTFGFGTRFCPGSHLARHEIRAAMDAVLDRLPNLTLVEAATPTGGQRRTCDSVVARWDVAAR